jgi:hypothetical protein
MPFNLHPSGVLTFSDPSGLKPGAGGFRGFGASRSRRGVFFDRASVLWYKNKNLNFFTFTIPQQLEHDTFYAQRFSMLLENYRTRYKRNKPDGFSDYVYCAETQKRGAIHFHLLAPAYVPIRPLNDYWMDLVSQKSKNAVDVQHVPKEIKSIPAYMCKYFTKQTYRATDGSIQRHRTLECRSFNSSKGLRLNPVTLDDPPGKPIAEKVNKFQRDGKTVEVIMRYYNTTMILDTFFADQI